MARQAISLILQYFFWMLIFFILRTMFIIYHAPLIIAEEIAWPEVLATFWHALYLDTATTCYILIVPFLLLSIQGFIHIRPLNAVNKIYTFVFLLISASIASAELGLYKEWKTKLTGKALTYLNHPAELYQSVSALQFFGLLLIILGITLFGYYIYQRVFFRPVAGRNVNRLQALVFVVLTALVLFIGMRGGTGPIPVTSGVAYFSRHSILNWAAVNSNYNLAVSVMEGQRYNETNPFDFYPMDEAVMTVDELQHASQDTTISILNLDRPNIVVVLMESWSADLIESLGGESGITPEFRKLEQEGLLFTNFYSSGNRSPQGLASILGGFPAIPYTTLTENPDKFQKLPSLNRELQQAGYESSFYFGGDLDYGNIKAYLLFNGFDRIFEDRDLPDSLPRGRLGIHDEFMMALHASEMHGHSRPFFSVMFTLSSHSPYDQPKEQTIEWQGLEAQFVKSAFYSDYSLGRYFDRVRKTGWYDSTLFLIVADHSHNTYRNWPIESFNYRKVPMLLLGGALKEEFRGMQEHRLSTTSDIPNTILRQLGINNGSFPWSRNLFNPYAPDYAYFEFNDGLGWKVHNGEFIYNRRYDQYLYIGMHESATPEDQARMIKQGKAFFQVLFQSFLDM